MSTKFVRLCSVVLSALLGAAAFLEPRYCCWFIFIFLVPILYVVVNRQACYTFCEGLLWGIIFFSLNMYGLLCVILERAHGQGSWVAFLALVVYCSLYSGLWLRLASLFALRSRNCFLYSLWWIVFTFVFFFFVYRVIFWIFDVVEGYPLALPLFPLAGSPQWLRLLPFVGTHILFFILVCFSYFFSAFLAEHRFCWLLGAVICFFPFSIGWFLPQKPFLIPDYVNHVAAVLPPDYSSANPLDSAQEITYRLMICCELNPEATILIMPESTFPFPLNEHPYFLKMLQQNVLCDKKRLILGAHRRDNNGLYNTFYCIKKGRIIHLYDKKHSIPFTERLPSLWNNNVLTKNLFINNKEQFIASKEPRKILSITKKMHILPYVCSELFFATQKEAGVPIVCIVNDSWFSAVYMRRLMNLMARYKALEWQQPVLYISHYCAQFINKDGQCCDMWLYQCKN